MDTHTAVKKLMNSGMPEKQAESVVEIQARLLDENLATKADITTIETELAAIKAEIPSIKIEIIESKTYLMKWIYVINFFSMAILAAAIELL